TRFKRRLLVLFSDRHRPGTRPRCNGFVDRSPSSAPPSNASDSDSVGGASGSARPRFDASGRNPTATARGGYGSARHRVCCVWQPMTIGKYLWLPFLVGCALSFAPANAHADGNSSLASASQASGYSDVYAEPYPPPSPIVFSPAE